MPDGHVNLPAVPDGTAVEEMVFDGEVVEEDRAPGLPVPANPAPGRAVTVHRVRTLGRHGTLVARGAVILLRRRRHARTVTQRTALQLAASGQQDKALAMLQHAELERQQRHGRLIKTFEVAATVVQVIVMLLANPKALAAIVILMLIAGKALGNPLALFLAARDAIRDVRLMLVWGPRIGVPVVLAAALLALHEIGRKADGIALGWGIAAKPGDEDRGLVVTADGIVVALQHLPISELKQEFKRGWQPAFRVTPVKDGEGYSAVFSLPMGVTPAMIADKNEIFARNLHRAKVEVWPTDAERDGVAAAGFVNLWVANPGVLDRPAPPWPLLNEGTADVFRGVPAGVTARGLPVLIPVVGNNFSIGGLMGQGKSNACRVVMLGAALDPLAELIVHVFAYNGDFDCFEPRLARYVKGAEEDEIDAAMETLNDLYRIVGEREQAISDLGAKKVTRHLAARHPELRPRLTLFSECHELFGHKDYGEEATELAVKTIRRARKCALWMGFDTQDARADAIPPKLLSLVSVRNCLPVTSWRANDGFLWDGAFKSGVRATELRAGRDTGRSLTTGVSNEQFEILKWHYIFSNDETGADDAKPVIERAMRNLAPGTAVAGAFPVVTVVRDLLADLAEVIDGPDRVRLADLPARLRKLDPAYPPYRRLDGVQLGQMLLDEDVRWTRPKNVPQLAPEDLRRALAERGELAVPLSRMTPLGPGLLPGLTRLTLPLDLIAAGHRTVRSGTAWIRNLTR